MQLLKSVRNFALKHPATFIFFSVFFVCSFFVLLMRHNLNPNLGDYDLLTNSILEGHSFFDPKGNFIFDYPPVQPYLLVAYTHIANWMHISRIAVVVFLSIVWFASTGVVLYQISRLINIQKSIAICLVLVFLNPMTLFLLTLPASEDIYILFYALSVRELTTSLILKNGKGNFKAAMLAGLWFGLAWLTRPIALFIPFCAAVVIVIKFRRSLAMGFQLAVLLIAVALLVTAPWQMFTYKHSGEFKFLSSRGINGLRDGLSNNSESKTYRAKFDFDADIDSMLARFQSNYNGYTKASQVKDFLVEEFKNNPGAVMRYYLIKAGRVFYGTDAHKVKEEKFVRLIMLPFFFCYILSIIYFFRKRKEYELAFDVTVFSLLATLSVWAIATITTSIARYMLPLMVINAMPTAFIIYVWYQKIRGRFQKNA